MSAKTPTLADLQKLLVSGEFVPGSQMSLAARAAENILMSNALSILADKRTIDIRLPSGHVVHYTWDSNIGGWQQVI